MYRYGNLDTAEMTALQIDGAFLTLTPDGITLKYGWMPAVDVSKADALKIRDWLNENFPVKPKDDEE